MEIDEKDLKVQTMRSTGAGGQHVNKTESAVRIRHVPSGLTVECQTSRSQTENRAEAMTKLRTALFQIDHERRLGREQSQRRLQIGTRDRGLKIRTYNVPDNRVTDHRIKLSLSGVDDILSAGPGFVQLQEALSVFHRRELAEELAGELCRGLAELRKPTESAARTSKP
jgi:peptide chain release factor 1